MRRIAERDGSPVQLTRKEFGVLEMLLAADGGYVSADDLLDEVWDEPLERTRGVVKIVVHTLRRKLGKPDVIESAAGHGYRMESHDDAETPARITTSERLSFRTRLALIITLVFMPPAPACWPSSTSSCSSCSSAIDVTAVSSSRVTARPPQSGSRAAQRGSLYGATGATAPSSLEIRGPGRAGAVGPVSSSRRSSSDEVVGGLLLWSIVRARRLPRRGGDRVLARPALARPHRRGDEPPRDISERDLGRRLDLPGPDDEIKELGDTIDGMLDRLQLAFAAQDRFVANASHELRTPLTTTRTALEIPLEQGDVPSDLKPHPAGAASDRAERAADHGAARPRPLPHRTGRGRTGRAEPAHRRPGR